MWCDTCKADVAAEVGPDNRRVTCSTCGNELRDERSWDRTRSARQLLERWAHDPVLEPSGSSAPTDPTATAVDETQIEETSPVADLIDEDPADAPPTLGLPKFRIDSGHPEHSRSEPLPENPLPGIAAATSTPETPAHRVNAEPPPSVEQPVADGQAAVDPRLVHQSHELPAPHIDVRAFLTELETPTKTSNWVAAAGQLLAYIGVGTLTVGAALVIWGYFGGPEQYAPTGWLVTTMGQMLLFLGVITLVSGGIEQTNAEVTRKIETIGHQILRIEEARQKQAVPPPHVDPRSFASPGFAPSSDTDSGSAETIPA